jgi:outer membrane protein OmpA-like peptidoglycan-associated protein
MNQLLKANLVTGAALTAAIACASSPPPRELLDARAAYSRAASGDAKELSPAALQDARKALGSAETAYEHDDSDYVMRDKAYVAMRKAELSEVLASAERARQNEAHARAEAERNRAAEEAAQQNAAAMHEGAGSDQGARAQEEAQHREALEKLAASNASLAVKDEPRGTVITVPSKGLFATGKSTLLPTAAAELEPVAEALAQDRSHEIVIEGHTDSQGSETKNLTLSQKRADAVKDFLVQHNVSSEQVTATGAGESEPIGDNKTAEGRATNRRVEIVVKPAER